MKKLYLALLAGVLAGCTSTDVSEITAAVAPGVMVQLPKPEYPGLNEIKQLITVSCNNEEHQLVTMVKTAPGKLEAAALTPSGIKLGSFSYNGKTLHAEQNFAGSVMPPVSQTVLDLLLSTLPLPVACSTLPASFQCKDDDQWRIIGKGDEVTYKIKYSKAKPEQILSIENFSFGYKLSIKEFK